MSAWKCSNGHLQFVAEIINRNSESQDQIELPVLTMALDSYNQKSLHARYNDPINVQIFPLIKIHESWFKQSGEVANALICYRYQTSESDEYNNSHLSNRIDNLLKNRFNYPHTRQLDIDNARWGLEIEELEQPYTQQKVDS
jgi:hypothetical protein